ncbi:meiotic recombination protein REC8 homolog isoform X2 [Mixophyes fleayi]|uniref:meiotic recombination protein REC8 homolog isoform X2 n=1 Tax=Mixophyes fleayi TaxID=3061075 RepID=UPI003F4D8959
MKGAERMVKQEFLLDSQKIVQYILQQVPPPYHGSPIPRLSLYLSAQLSYGVVCVYHRQCDLLIEEMKNTLERLHKVEKQMKIDLLQSDQALLLPDSLMLMQMLEDAPDPFFGMMEIPPELPDPLMIPQICMLLETSGPEIVRLEKSPPRRGRASKIDDTDHLTSPEVITMQEVEPVLLQSVEFGQDLPEVSALDLELLMSDLPPLPEVETLPQPRKTRERPKDTTREPKKDTGAELLKVNGEKIQEVQGEEIPQPDARQEIEAGKEKESMAEIESKRRELQEKVRERERLREQERQTKLQQESERERERKEEAKREKERKQEADREIERLKKASEELKHLNRAGAKEEVLLKKQREIENLKALQKERERKWEAEKLKQHLSEKEKERERLQERERDRQRLREAEQEIERVKKSLEVKEAEERRIEPERMIPEKEEDVDSKRRREPETPTVRHLPKSGVPSETVSELDAAVLLDEVTGEPITLFPEGSPEIPSILHTSPHLPSPHPTSPQLVLVESPIEAEARPASRRSVRRTSLLIDSITQIESKMMQEQTKDPHIYTQAVVPVTLPHMKTRTPASLFTSPTYQQFMAPELRALWSRCALLEPLERIQEREEESMSELEVVRAATGSGVSLLLSSEVSLEVSEEERSRPILFTPEERRAISVQDDRFLPVVAEMPELIVEMPETDEILLSDVQRNLYAQIENFGHSDFHNLTPQSYSRLLVSRFFFGCLVLCTQQVIHLEQTKPYGRIAISPGKRYSQD